MTPQDEERRLRLEAAAAEYQRRQEAMLGYGRHYPETSTAIDSPEKVKTWGGLLDYAGLLLRFHWHNIRNNF